MEGFDLIHKITLIPGDGIGREVAHAAKLCVEAAGVKVEWEEGIGGEEAMKKFVIASSLKEGERLLDVCFGLGYNTFVAVKTVLVTRHCFIAK